MMENEMKARLITAFEWTCPACGRINYCSSILVEDPDANREAREEHGFDGDLCMAPETVRCEWCRKRFETEEDE